MLNFTRIKMQIYVMQTKLLCVINSKFWHSESLLLNKMLKM